MLMELNFYSFSLCLSVSLSLSLSHFFLHIRSYNTLRHIIPYLFFLFRISMSFM